MGQIDYVILYVFLFFNFIIGIYYGRKVNTIREYSVGRQSYSEFVLLATVFATVIGGGSTFGIVEKVYLSGFSYALVFMGMAFNRIWIGSLVGRNLRSFSDCTTVSEIMGKEYGVTARKITSIFGILSILGGFSAQTYTIGFVISQITEITHFWGIIIGAGVLVAYSAFGGMRSVVATDVLQFCFIFALIPLLLFMVTESTSQDSLVIVNNIYNALFSGKINIMYLSLFLVLCFASGDPAFMQRIFLSRNVEIVGKSIRLTGYVTIIFYFIMGLLGLLAQKVLPGYDKSPLVPIINTYIPIGFKGVLLCSLLAAVMSTADSGLNMIGISFGNDFKESLKDSTKLLVARISTVFIGFFAIVIATQFKSILDIIVFGFTFWGPSVFIPLMGALLGKKVSQKDMYIGVVLGMSICIFCNILLKDKIGGFEGAVIGMLLHASYFYIKIKKE